MADIRFNVFSRIGKHIQIAADDDKYKGALKLIGCKKIGKNSWTLKNPVKNENEKAIFGSA